MIKSNCLPQVASGYEAVELINGDGVEPTFAVRGGMIDECVSWPGRFAELSNSEIITRDIFCPSTCLGGSKTQTAGASNV